MRQLLVHQPQVGDGKVGQVHALGGLRLVRAYQVAVYLLGDEGCQRRQQPRQGGEAAVQRGVGRQLVGVVLALPEAAAAAPDVPVGEVLHKALYAATGVGGVVAVQRGGHIGGEQVKL